MREPTEREYLEGLMEEERDRIAAGEYGGLGEIEEPRAQGETFEQGFGRLDLWVPAAGPAEETR